ncbi:response regulator transcription factor [Streptomyces sp. IBSNAI002]|uniref:response regulator transcription factor n=1 Tax=Streptomyces sp. IBSNAI002 TaxID=3457500 RepID=UPI003FD01070
MISTTDIRRPADSSAGRSAPAATVLIAARDAAFRAGLGRLLSDRCGFEVVAEAGSGPEAARLTGPCSPRILLVERELAKAMGPLHGPGLVLIADEPGPDGLADALAAGARGFVPRSPDPRLLEAVLRHVLAGGCALAGEAFGELTGAPGRPYAPRFAGHHRRIPLLSARERDVLGLLGRGLDNVGIAGELRLSLASVKTHVSRLLAKLHLENRTQAALVANEAGLADPLGVPG